MSRLIVATVTVLLLFAAVPAFAEEIGTEPAVAAPADDVADDASPGGDVAAGEQTCDNPEEFDVVTLAGLASQITAPDLSLTDTEIRSILVDLGPDAASATADLTVDMTWDTLLNDYDLEVVAQETARSESAQPFDPNVESVTVPVAHCQVVDVIAYNFFALQPTTSLSLAFTIGEPAVEETFTSSALPYLEVLDAVEALSAQ